MTFLIYLLVIALLVFLDQLSKYYIVSFFALGEKLVLIRDLFNITHVHNYGAGFSILQNERLILIGAPLIAIAYLCFLLFGKRKKKLAEIISYVLIIAGAIGNLIDRIKLGYVVDFLDIYIFGYDFPVFNVADSFITIGCFLLLLFYLKDMKDA